MRRTLCLVVALAAIVVTQTAGSARRSSRASRPPARSSHAPPPPADGSSGSAPTARRTCSRSTRAQRVSAAKIGFGSCGLGWAPGSLWIEDTNTNTISRVSATRESARRRSRSGRRRTTRRSPTAPPGQRTKTAAGEVERIDPATRQGRQGLASCSTANGVVGAFGRSGRPARDASSASTPRPTRWSTTSGYKAAAWTAASTDAIWVTTPPGVARIDPPTNTVAATSRSRPLGDPAVVAGTASGFPRSAETRSPSSNPANERRRADAERR